VAEVRGQAAPAPRGVRIDKWLWAARFFKTRSLAVEALQAGRVELLAEPAKPSRMLRVGDLVTIRRPPRQWTVEVLALSEVRGPAPAARALYSETPQSQEVREAAEAAYRLAPEPAQSRRDGRPTKRERRDLVQWDRWSAAIDP
jgi:ribosome-associated heat shock protein Hsp15